MSRSRLFIAGLVMALLLSVVGSAFAQDTLVIWADETRAPLLEELGQQFFDEFGVEVSVQEMGLGPARDQLLVAGPVGEGPDILIIPHDNIGQLVANGAILPMDLSAIEADLLPSSISLMTFANQVWALPYAMENVALVRNTDLIPEPITSWEQFLEIGAGLQEQGIFTLAIPTGNAYHNYPVTTGFGGYIFGLNEDGTYNVADIGLASEGGLAAGEFLSEIYTTGVAPADTNDDVMFSLFEEGKVGAFITGPWFSQRIIDTGVPYAIDPFPSGHPFSGGQGFAISAFSQNPLLAEEFLFNFVATDETMQRLFDEGGRIPAWASVDTAADINIASFIAAGTEAEPMPAIPEMGAVWGAAGDALTLISQGQEPVATLQNAVNQISDAIKLVQSDETIVGLPGSHQAAVGCPGDWDPACELTFLADMGDGTWTLTLSIPAGAYEYKIAYNGGWDTNFGVDGEPDGPNYQLTLDADSTVTFTYDQESHVVTTEIGG
jgi:arabinogalactan oligomer / maltooligosaccharide transport system substrate-binding protein